MRCSWLGTAAASLLCITAGCATVPQHWLHTQRRVDRTSQPALTKKSARPAKSSDAETVDQLTVRTSADSAETSDIPSPDPIRLTTGLESDAAVVSQADHSPLNEAPLEVASADNVDGPSALLPGPAQSEGQVSENAASQPELPTGYALSLGNVLYLADAQNPNVAFARERINEAYARVDRADALWLPSIRAGMNYVHHEGNVQDVIGNVFGTNKSAFYGGLGAGGTGSGSPTIPGVVAQFHLTDAIFQPKITEHQAASRQFGATAVRNDTLRNTALAYLELLRAEQALAITEEALTNTKRLAKLTGDYARTGQGLRSDHERMLAEQAIREADVYSRVEAVRVTSARLAQLLHSDPSVRISSGEPMVIPLDLVDRAPSSASFVATGLMRRPELAEQKHLVCEAVERLNREKFAPLVPSVLLGVSYGGLGGGQGSSITNTADRWDADALAYWELRNFGVGERAARNEMSSLVRQTQHRELALMDQVAREVVEAHTQVLERARRIAVSKQGIAAAERSYQLNENRIENAQGLPIESLQAVQALAAARLSYLNAVIDYNIAQFELCRATGWFEDESKAF